MSERKKKGNRSKREELLSTVTHHCGKQLIALNISQTVFEDCLFSVIFSCIYYIVTWQQKYSEIGIRRITHSPFPLAPRKTVQLMDIFSLLTFCVGERRKKKCFFSSPWYIKARNQLLAELSKSCGIMGDIGNQEHSLISSCHKTRMTNYVGCL